jgi:eukaryotic-like serine/threonine-protein kinase
VRERAASTSPGYLPGTDANGGTLPPPGSPAGYEILREIGRGGMARVYVARELKHDRLVALKVLEPEVADAVAAERFVEEIRILATLQHPHIVPLFDSGVWDGAPFYSMPVVDGESLRHRLEREGRLPVAQAVKIALDVADGLAHAHRTGVVHRDIKPENVLLTGDEALLADFGIAFALRRAGAVVDRQTRGEFVVGTQPYMSPEHMSGGSDIDGRSDIYALGCVLYEMLTGRVPFTRNDSAEQRISPPSPRRTRGEVPARLDALIRRSLAIDRAKRPASAEQFAEELRAAMDAPSTLPRTLGMAAAIALVAVGAWMFANRRVPPVLDSTAYAVFPFRHAAGVPSSWLDGEGCARLLYDAINRWRGVRVVNDLVISDAWRRQRPRSVSEVLAVAESLQAGHAAWGEVLVVGDSMEVRTTVYDVARGQGASRQFVVRTGRSIEQLQAAFTALADSVVIGGQLGPDPSLLASTRDVRAIRAYLEGRAALDRFDLRTAEARLNDAVLADAGFAHALLWLARVMAWSGWDMRLSERREPYVGWGRYAANAAELGARLPQRERRHAEALHALGAGQPELACRRFRELIASDSSDFAAWLGLGDCNSMDMAVVRAPSGGWMYRGSHNEALRAYRRALDLVPSFNEAERGLAVLSLTSRVLVPDGYKIRRGFALSPDTVWYGSHAAFAGDSLSHVPHPYGDVLSGRPGTRPDTHADAVLWSRRVVEELSSDWVRAFPQSPEAHEAWALSLERLGRIAGMNVASAIRETRKAAELATTDEMRVRLANSMVRLWIKSAQWDSARLVADSMLADLPREVSPRSALLLASVAAVTGRARSADRLLRRAAEDPALLPFVASDGRRIPVSPSLGGDAFALLMYSALGAPVDSIRTIYARVDRDIALTTSARDRMAVRDMLLETSTGLAWSVLPRRDITGLDVSRDALLRMWPALNRGNRASAAAHADSLSALTSSLLPGNMGLDRTLHLARVRLALGDTAAAIRTLDGALADLPSARPILLRAVQQASSVGNALLMRAQLAAATGDRATAARYSSAIASLWAGGDPEFRASVAQLQTR